jgi:hypothetical protein
VSEFPKEPQKRRVVLVVDPHEKEKLQLNGDTGIFLDPHAHVVTYSDEVEKHGGLRLLQESGLLTAGNLLVQSPYEPDVYVDAEQAVEQFALAKQTIFLNFCQLLGARRVTVRQITTEEMDSAETIKLDGGYGAASGSVKGGRSSVEKLAAKLSLVDEFVGGEPDLPAAEQFLQTYRLAGDLVMRSLLQARKAKNVIKRRTVTINLTSEARNNLNIVGKLKLPAIKFNGNYDKIKSQRNYYELTMDVEFEDVMRSAV